MGKRVILDGAGGGATSGQITLNADVSQLTLEGAFDGETATLYVVSSQTGTAVPVDDNSFTTPISKNIKWKKGGIIKLDISNGGGSPSITATLEE